MILDIFIPETWGDKRLLSKKIVAFSIEPSHVRMMEVHIASSKTTILSIAEEPVSVHVEDPTYQAQLQHAIATLYKKASKHDYVRISLPTSIVLFKEIQVPLKERDKLSMVVDFEIESMLPFPLHEATVDFVITRQKKDEDVSQLLVAAVRKDDLNSFVDIFQKAGVIPTHVTVDLFAFYNMYHQMPAYNSITDGSALIDVGFTSTRIAFLQNGELRLIRTISKGIETIINTIVDEAKLPLETIKQHLFSRGLKGSNSSDPLDKIIHKHIINFLTEIQFTLNSFSLKLNFYKEIQNIIFITIDEYFKDFSSFAATVLQTPCEQFNIAHLFGNKKVISKVSEPSPSWNSYTLLLGTALPSIGNFDFDLLRKSIKPVTENLVKRQVIALTLLIFAIFASLLTNGFLQIRALSSKARAIEQKEIKKLYSILQEGKRSTRDSGLLKQMQKALNDKNLSSLLKKTNSIVDEEKKGWELLANLKIHPLMILEELISIIDRVTFNIRINSISITNDDIGMDRTEVVGFLKSRTEGHWQEFAKFKQSIAERIDTTKLTLVSIEESQGEEEEGVKFELTFKQKEQAIS